MRRRATWHAAGPAAVLAAFAMLFAAPAAEAANTDPLYEFFASVDREGAQHAPYPPPGSGFEGPCGAAVDSKGNFYVADYHHHAVDVFTYQRTFLTQLSKVGSRSGPCGLAIAPSGALYVNEYHQGVLRYLPTSYPLGPGATYGPPVEIDDADSTGVATDLLSGRVYVNDRNYIAVYDSSGAPVLDGEGHPLRIGEGSLEDGYGLTLAQPPAPNAGRLYVADASGDVIKVYDPDIDVSDPVEVIDGHETPTGGFVSLRDSTLAVDRNSGQVYVADNLLPQGQERPEAAIYAFKAGGAYVGRLKYNVVDGLPVGLAVDQFGIEIGGEKTLGRVYVTSGNSAGGRLFAYGPEAISTLAAACAPEGPCPGGGTGTADSASALKAAFSPSTPAALPEARPRATVAQRGTLRVSSEGSISPSRLPRKGAAPIAVSVSGQISTTDGSEPPQLKAMRIEINRHGRLDTIGLPVCPYAKIATASSQRAMKACKSALVGRGSFTANIVLSGQEPYPTEGKLLVFNGEKHGKPVLYGQIYSARPFATSFVIVFSISKISQGVYGTALSADLPQALGNWGYLTGIKMRLSRRYGYAGKSRSFLSAGCPAPPGFSKIAFSLARTSFTFDGAGSLSSTLTRECGAQG